MASQYTWPIQEAGRAVALDLLANPSNYGKDAYLAWTNANMNQRIDKN